MKITADLQDSAKTRKHGPTRLLVGCVVAVIAVTCSVCGYLTLIKDAKNSDTVKESDTISAVSLSDRMEDLETSYQELYNTTFGDAESVSSGDLNQMNVSYLTDTMLTDDMKSTIETAVNESDSDYENLDGLLIQGEDVSDKFLTTVYNDEMTYLSYKTNINYMTPPIVNENPIAFTLQNIWTDDMLDYFGKITYGDNTDSDDCPLNLSKKNGIIYASFKDNTLDSDTYEVCDADSAIFIWKDSTRDFWYLAVIDTEDQSAENGIGSTFCPYDAADGEDAITLTEDNIEGAIQDGFRTYTLYAFGTTMWFS